MKSFRLRTLTGAAAVAVVGSALMLALTPSTTLAGSTSTSTVYYQVNPIARLALASPGATPGAFPYTPSQCVASFGLACYSPQDLRAGYNFPSKLTGAGQTIVLIDAYGSPTIQSDLATYDQEFGLPAATLNIFYPTGQPTYNPLQNHQETSWAEETSLDVEQSHGLAPGATIDLVVAPNNSGNALNNAEQYAVNLHLGNVLSMSFGAPENAFNGNNDQLSQAEAIYQQAVSQGMSVFASAGDSGATEGTSSSTALFPASDPLVTSVGGTDLFLSDRGTYQSETTWNDSVSSLCPFGCSAGPFGATGGAPSILFTQPGYQSADGSGYPGRTVADVSFNASVYTATMIYLGFLGASSNGFYFFGGTSEGSPSWAAITALADQAAGHPLGQLNPLLYSIYANARAYAADFHNIYGPGQTNAFGSTVGYPATSPGYNLPTGLGTPNVANLISSLAGGGRR
ncbi:MAG TPA: S53 family peptidase [Candidatus Nanopelagicaceae bacterium]|nr:S53 family peptidase [Candidatus Nanopelagicaceae bacterium]